MGLALGDYDNDGDFDVYVTNIFALDNPEDQGYNVLFRNDTISGEPMFSDVSFASGVERGYWGWGATFLDGDNDGWLDIAATNGRVDPDPSVFFLNPGSDGGEFENVSESVGFDDTFYGSTLISLDFDRDGDVDLVQSTQDGPLRLLENRSVGDGGAIGHFLVIRPRMSGANRRAIGATVSVEVDGLVMTRQILAGTSYLGQEPAEAHFGLGDGEWVDRVRVRWLGGGETTLEGVSADRVITIGNVAGDCDFDGDVDLEDHALLVGCVAASEASMLGTCWCGDLNYDGGVDLVDWGVFQTRLVAR
jgi:enediyne biosynthesis protein E4